MNLFADYFTAVDHWVAFALLVLLGGKMPWEALSRSEDDEAVEVSTGAD